MQNSSRWPLLTCTRKPGIFQRYCLDFNQFTINFKICKTILDGYFWRVHGSICSVHNETETPDKWPGVFIRTLLESHICNICKIDKSRKWKVFRLGRAIWNLGINAKLTALFNLSLFRTSFKNLKTTVAWIYPSFDFDGYFKALETLSKAIDKKGFV